MHESATGEFSKNPLAKNGVRSHASCGCPDKMGMEPATNPQAVNIGNPETILRSRPLCGVPSHLDGTVYHEHNRNKHFRHLFGVAEIRSRRRPGNLLRS